MDFPPLKRKSIKDEMVNRCANIIVNLIITIVNSQVYRSCGYIVESRTTTKLLWNHRHNIKREYSDRVYPAAPIRTSFTAMMSTTNPQQVPPSLVVSFRDTFIPSTSLNSYPNDPSVKSINNNTTKKGLIQFILASQSPRRREILDMMGLNGLYAVQVSPLDESALATKLLMDSTSTKLDPKDYTCILAKEKALALANQIVQQNVEERNTKIGLQQKQPPILIVGSDTIVVLDDKILEKPKDQEDAKRMLRMLSNKRHVVHTGVALVCVVPVSTPNHEWNIQVIESFVDTTSVQFTNLSDVDIESYVSTNEPMDKAGSYGIQGIGGQLIERIDGDYFTVMGLPMHKTSKALVKAIAYIGSTC